MHRFAGTTLAVGAVGAAAILAMTVLPGYTGYGCGFRFTVVAVWSPGVNTLVSQFAGVRIETY